MWIAAFSSIVTNAPASDAPVRGTIWMLDHNPKAMNKLFPMVRFGNNPGVNILNSGKRFTLLQMLIYLLQPSRVVLETLLDVLMKSKFLELAANDRLVSCIYCWGYFWVVTP